MLKEMETVWDKFFNKEEPTVDDIEALYNALKARRAENAGLDALRKAEDPSYKRLPYLNGLDSESEVEAYNVLEGFTRENFEKNSKDIISLLEDVYTFT